MTTEAMASAGAANWEALKVGIQQAMRREYRWVPLKAVAVFVLVSVLNRMINQNATHSAMVGLGFGVCMILGIWIFARAKLAKLRRVEHDRGELLFYYRNEVERGIRESLSGGIIIAPLMVGTAALLYQEMGGHPTAGQWVAMGGYVLLGVSLAGYLLLVKLPQRRRERRQLLGK